MDDWATFPGIADKPALLAREHELVGAADLVVVSSGTIRERWAPHRDDLLLLRNAADFAHFHAGAGDDPLPEVAGQVAGYFGAIAGWFDVPLLAAVAAARPQVTFALLGEVFDADVGPLAALPNVLLLGHQPYDRLPAFLRRFDACLVPFDVSPATDGMDVVKVYEYLSQGKPVVSTPIREIVHLAPLVRLAADAESFGRALDAALAEDDPEAVAARLDLARRNTWAQRVDEMEREVRWRSRQPGARHRAALASLRRDVAALESQRDALRTELDAIHASRFWRWANVYWRLRRRLARR
jgi:glycosyltransferase involved in cell wall biosynthesis